MPETEGGFTMTKQMRQQKVLNIVSQEKVYTLPDLLGKLGTQGYKVNVSTISRDISELGIIKTLEGYKAMSPQDGPEVLPALTSSLQQMVTGINIAGNITLIHTITGGAQAVGRLIDTVPNSTILGTVAGDDTIIAVSDTNTNAKKFVEWLSNMIENKKEK